MTLYSRLPFGSRVTFVYVTYPGVLTVTWSLFFLFSPCLNMW